MCLSLQHELLAYHAGEGPIEERPAHYLVGALANGVLVIPADDAMVGLYEAATRGKVSIDEVDDELLEQLIEAGVLRFVSA